MCDLHAAGPFNTSLARPHHVDHEAHAYTDFIQLNTFCRVREVAWMVGSLCLSGAERQGLIAWNSDNWHEFVARILLHGLECEQRPLKPAARRFKRKCSDL